MVYWLRSSHKYIKTGQQTSYHTGDDGYYQKGLDRLYDIKTTGQFAGTCPITINGKTHNLSNNVVQDLRMMNTGGFLEWARFVCDADIGPAEDGKLYWEQWTLLNKTDISFTAVTGADVLGGLGDCATDFFDTVQAPWTHDAVNEWYDIDGSQEGIKYLIKNNVLTIGVTYKVTWDIARTAGIIVCYCGATPGAAWESGGTKIEYVTCAGNTNFGIGVNADFVGSTDNIVIEPVTGGEINSAAGDFDTDACCEGRKVTVSGSTSNDGTYTVSAVVATKLTVSETSIQDEAAGDTISVVTVDDLIWDLVDQANANSLGGYTDWRVPNYNELASLFLFGSGSPYIDQTAFPSAPTGYHWSSTTFDGAVTVAMIFSFGYTYVVNTTKDNTKYLCRLVRGG